MLLSGVNCEGKSIMFAWGFLKDPNIENYSWFLNKFIKFMAEDEICKNLVNLDNIDMEEENNEDHVEFQKEEGKEEPSDLDELKNAWLKSHEFFEGHQTIITAYDMNLSYGIENTFKKASNSLGVGSITHKFCQTSVRDRIAIYFPTNDEDNASQAFKLML